LLSKSPRNLIGAGDFREWMLEKAPILTGAETFDPTQGVQKIMPVRQLMQYNCYHAGNRVFSISIYPAHPLNFMG